MTKPLRLTCCIALTLVGVPAARADFLLVPAPPVADLQAASQVPVPLARPARPIAETPLPPPVTHALIARGFGRRVPLSFAVRQIVPTNVKVIYANDVDTGETVDWHGGDAWTTVLARAVRSVGLRFELTPGTVTILSD